MKAAIPGSQSDLHERVCGLGFLRYRGSGA
jgi:hypothetical protein